MIFFCDMAITSASRSRFGDVANLPPFLAPKSVAASPTRSGGVHQPYEGDHRFNSRTCVARLSSLRESADCGFCCADQTGGPAQCAVHLQLGGVIIFRRDIARRSIRSAPGEPPLLQVPAGCVNVHGHVHQKESPSRNRHINVSVEQLNYRPGRLRDIRRLARRLLEGRTVPGHSTRARLNVVERIMP